MKFYDIYADPGGNEAIIEEVCEHGEWATRADVEQVKNELDEFERKLRELCQAHGALLIKFHDAAKDAVWEIYKPTT